MARIFIPLGIAFQIQDDILNLTGDFQAYSKDFCGDLWEGKHTLILIHALRRADPFERARALDVLARPRPLKQTDSPFASVAMRNLLSDLVASGDITSRGYEELRAYAERAETGEAGRYRGAEDVAFLRELVDRYGSIPYAFDVAQRHARRFERELKRAIGGWPASVHRDFLIQLAEYVIRRTH
jgi:geranylgeranyl diphosphate synthase type II